MTRRWTLALLAATHAFQPHAPVQRLRPLSVEVFDEATLLIEQAVEWSRDEHPLAEPCVCETAEPIVTSTIFWSVVNDACQFPAKEATIIFDKDDFPVDEWADMVSSLQIEGLTCEVEDEAPLPCVKISVDWDPEDAGFVSDEMADASVESLKTWVQDVIVDSKVCPFTRSAEVAACVEINQCVSDDGAVLARSSGEEPAPPRRRAGVASMAWRSTRTRRKTLISTQFVRPPPRSWQRPEV